MINSWKYFSASPEETCSAFIFIPQFDTTTFNLKWRHDMKQAEPENLNTDKSILKVLKSLNTIVLWCCEGFPKMSSSGHIWCREMRVFQLLILYTEKFLWNIIKSNRNQIVFAIFRLIWNSKRTLSVCCSKSIGIC